MKKIFVFLLLFISFQIIKSQELNATVVVNFDRVNASNISLYKDMERDLTNFINGTKWTNEAFLSHEKIECTFRFLISEINNGDSFKATLQVQARRPVFGSIYHTPIVNIQDDKGNFTYTQNQQISFNIRSFSGKNLPELIAYYSYIILGYDADSFQLKGGSNHFSNANQIADLSFNQGFEGWEMDGTKSRKQMVSNILSNDLEVFRNSWYIYHRFGLDKMHEVVEEGKENVAQALLELDKLKVNFTNNFNTIELFVFLKQDEIIQIFSQKGKDEYKDIAKIKSVLNKLSPTKKDKWNKLH
jgi:hypothetical protein